jgi:GDP-L-fucose synthase|tara:strand:- start:3122 stop:4060 length:939 start_codon:yes stop_codon:yes gene_type:complete
VNEERYLLLGGTGFIGKNIMNVLNSEGKKSLCVGSDQLKDDFHSSLRDAILDFRPTGVVFLAAKVGSMASIRENPFAFILENTQIFIDTFSVFEQCFDEGHRFKILNIISNCVYPESSDYQTEKDVLNGRPHPSVDPFAQAKRMLIALGNNFAISHDAEVLNLILANSFGPYDHIDSNRSHALTGMIVRMIQAKRSSSKTFDVWGTGAPVRSWLYAPDFAEQVLQIFEEKAMWKQQVLNFPASIQDISVKELALQIAQEVKYEGKIIFDASKGDGDPVKILVSNEFETFFKPKMRKFSNALRDTVLYFEKNI